MEKLMIGKIIMPKPNTINYENFRIIMEKYP
jgi:hypothetical protein